jgi:hypothetical protein
VFELFVYHRLFLVSPQHLLRGVLTVPMVLTKRFVLAMVSTQVSVLAMVLELVFVLVWVNSLWNRLWKAFLLPLQRIASPLKHSPLEEKRFSFLS